MGKQYILGLDLGQASDYSALCVVERIEPPRQPASPGWNFSSLSGGGSATRYFDGSTFSEHAPVSAASQEPTFDVRYIKRFDRGTPYPVIVDKVVDRYQELRADNDVRLVIDGTGVGRAVVDLFRPRIGGDAHPVTIHGGDAVTKGDDGYLRVPKRELASCVQAALQTDRLRWPRRDRWAGVLTEELKNFKVKINIQTGHDSYAAWRESDHDDLVLALSLAVFYGETQYSLGIYF